MPPAHPQDLDEDDVVLDAFRKLAPDHPGLLLFLVPRKPERFDAAAQKLDATGVRYLRRSALTEESALELPAVLLVDSMGELSGLFSLADVVFMGGTLAERGGHNILEPAFFGRPIIVGPHMENFPDIAAEYSAARAYVEIGSAEELAAAVENLLASPQQCEALGQRARNLAEARRGATQAAVDEIASEFNAEARRSRRGPQNMSFNNLCETLRNLCASRLSHIWKAVSKWQRTHTAARQLNTPVISVGGIAMGGVGKTPFVAWLVGRLKAGGHYPAVLTRGYRRRSWQIALVAPGSWAPIRLTGDEPQVLLRAGIGPVGIGRNRFEAGRRMEERFQCGVFVLDDGFQHWRLGRDLDIVLIDALDPFGGGEVFPLGRLREPPEALARADAIVITRAEPGKAYDEIVSLVREHNDSAPVFTSRVVPGPWVDPDGWGAYEYEAPFSRAAAFCGLANPEAFWRTLESLGIRPVRRWSFRDHHRYRARELRRMAAQAWEAGAQALVTTEKDAVNLPRDWRDRIAPLNIHVLRIDLAVDNEEALLSLIRRRI
jgi:tetraacyldisaccharide 4'-kinase